MAGEHTREAALSRAAAALQAGNLEIALREANGLDAELARDPALAVEWLDLLREAPVPAIAEWVGRVLAHHPDHAPVVTRACDALIRVAERAAPDEPQPEGGPAQRAAEAAARCLVAPGTRAAHPDLVGYLHMSRANALRLLRAHDEALASYHAALAERPERGSWWFNLGLLHKAKGEWAEAFAINQRAHALLGDEKPVLWNLAISATALGRGRDAVAALRKLGLDAQLAESGMPYVDGLLPAQLRVASVGAGLGAGAALPDRSVGLELLWVTPLSPCHGVVSSASQRETSVDFGDVVLWDVIPVGIGEHGGKPVPRFPLLAILRRGDERRFRFVALQQSAGDVASFAEKLPGEARLFIHHERVELLCARCASGEHMHKHRHEPPEEHRLVYGKLVLPGSVDLAVFRRDLEARLRAEPAIQLVVPGLLEAIGDTPAAGKAHQLWRGLERMGLKLQSEPGPASDRKPE
jgi:tetratricopeptide (TPR) repeat protein